MRTIAVSETAYSMIRAQWVRQRKRGATELTFREWCTQLLTMSVRDCIVCGCTDDDACDEGCSWVSYDLCSACVVRTPARSESEVEGARA